MENPAWLRGKSKQTQEMQKMNGLLQKKVINIKNKKKKSKRNKTKRPSKRTSNEEENFGNKHEALERNSEEDN